MQKSWKIGLCCATVLVSGLLGAVWWNDAHSPLDAERILANSKLNGRTFKGEVVEVKADNNSLHAYLMEEHSVPLAAISFGFDRAGTAYEPKEGVALLTESVLLDGAGRFSRKELRETMKEKGIKLSVSAGDDRLAFSLSFVKKFEKEALEILKAVLYDAHFNKEDIDLARRQLAVLRQQQKESPQYQLNLLIDKTFYGEHPYAKEGIPDDAVLAKVSVQDMRNYLKQFMAKDTLSVGIAGDMDKAESEAFLTQVFAGLNDTSKGADLPEFTPDWKAKKAVEVSDISAQSLVLLKSLGVPRLDADFYPLLLADYVFGGAGLSSRLSLAVRENEGLTYSIGTSLGLDDKQPLLVGSYSATPANFDRVGQILLREWKDFAKNGVTKSEVKAAKDYLIASYNLRFASIADIATILAYMQRDNLGRDFLEKRNEYVDAVKVEQVNNAAAKYFDENKLIQVNIGNFAKNFNEQEAQ